MADPTPQNRFLVAMRNTAQAFAMMDRQDREDHQITEEEFRKGLLARARNNPKLLERVEQQYAAIDNFKTVEKEWNDWRSKNTGISPPSGKDSLTQRYGEAKDAAVDAERDLKALMRDEFSSLHTQRSNAQAVIIAATKMAMEAEAKKAAEEKRAAGRVTFLGITPEDMYKSLAESELGNPDAVGSVRDLGNKPRTTKGPITDANIELVKQRITAEQERDNDKARGRVNDGIRQQAPALLAAISDMGRKELEPLLAQRAKMQEAIALAAANQEPEKAQRRLQNELKLFDRQMTATAKAYGIEDLAAALDKGFDGKKPEAPKPKPDSIEEALAGPDGAEILKAARDAVSYKLPESSAVATNPETLRPATSRAITQGATR